MNVKDRYDQFKILTSPQVFTPSKVRAEITHPFSNFNGGTV